MISRRLWAVPAALALLAAACGGGSDATVETSEAPPAAETGAADTADTSGQEAAPASSIVATTVDGGQIDFGSLQGQDVVLWFWAPW